MLYDLLQKGFLPKELPPVFNSLSFGRIAFAGAALPAAFSQANRPEWTLPMHHNLSRVGGLRRRLTIPNPMSYYRLCEVFDTNKIALLRDSTGSPYSHTAPCLNPISTRAIATKNVDRSVARAHSRVGARYVLKADIAQFYTSIYTHAVPWAVHTKPVAKKRMRDLSLYGNLLDRELQACQNGQTKGIAIGPDTSLAIAELLLASVDISISQQCDIIGGVRFIDDMELTFRSLSNAESALIALEAGLYEFELQLNGNKTAIMELPSEIESVFVTKLRAFIPATEDGSPASWIDYFNRAFLLAKSNPSEGVLRYAVASLQAVTASEAAWPLVQSLLWQCIALDPGCLRLVLDIILLNSHSNSELVIDNVIASRAINALISASAPVGHGSEVLWSIWAAMVLNIPLQIDSQHLIASMDDGCVATLATLAAHAGGVFEVGFRSAIWESWLVDDCFKQEYWMFAYESFTRGWYAPTVNRTNIAANAAAVFLKNNNVTFLNPTAASTYIPAFEAGGGSNFKGY